MSKNNRILFLSVVGLSLLGFGAAWLYYRGVNSADDPRTMPAREMLADYEKVIRQGRFLEALPLLDSIEFQYQKLADYSGSYEFGVIENNRATAYLMEALYDSLLQPGEKERLLSYARDHLMAGIGIYEHWLDSVKLMNEPAMRELLQAAYFSPECDLKGANPQKVLDKRLKDIDFARTEATRRLSVSYTNLGIVQRHQLQPDSAMFSYVKAIDFWEDNHQAKSNLDVLMGKEPRKRNIIQKMFPPKRKE